MKKAAGENLLGAQAPCTPVSEENILNSVLGSCFSSPFLSACCPCECPEPCRVDGPGLCDDTDMVMLGDASIFAKSKTSEDRCARSGGGAQSRRPFHLHCLPLACLSPPAGRPVALRRPVFLLASFLTGTLQGNAVPTTRRVSTTFSRTRDSNLGAIGDSVGHRNSSRCWFCRFVSEQLK